MNREFVSQRVSQSNRKIPPGTITIWPGSTAPAGWLLCDGTGYATTAYPALYVAITTTYGSSGGFQVPDMRTRVPYSSGAAGATGGTSTETLTAAQSALQSHSHTYYDQYPNTDFAATYADSNYMTSMQGLGTPTETSTGFYIGSTLYSSGINATDAHTNLQPYLLLNFIIKT